MNVGANEDFRDSSNDKNQQIVKGKRTKRQTPSSPFGVAVTDTSSPSSGGERPEEVGGGGCRTFSSPATTSSEMSTTTEEDEDIANCLILLAQNCRAKAKMEKEAKVKKLAITTAAAAAGTTGKVAEVYECRTCNRSFPSFQALGGHRASHKKLKIMPEEKTISLGDVERKVSERQTQEEGLLHKIVSVEKVSCSNNKGNKMHKCSICGSEFSSGQALGGHMRRHRTSSGSTHRMNNTVQSSVLDHTRNILPLDLNLPAPEEEGEDHQLDSEEFQLIKTNQKQHLYFSYPAVVDCHY